MPHHKKQDIRRRTGCFQCKEKHIRCTEEQPQCRRCERFGLKCTRGVKLIFREDAIQRGIRFGREGVWTKRPKANIRHSSQDSITAFQAVPLHRYVGKWVFLNTTWGDLHSGFGPDKDRRVHVESEAKSDQDTLPNTLPNITLPIHAPFYHPLSSFPQIESHLLNYFIRVISPNCSLSESDNPYLSLITPLCFSSSPLRHTLLAVAANQLCLLGDTRLANQTCQFKDRALQGLRHAISANTLDDGTVATVLMLCFQEISDGCSPSWMTHLRGGLQLVDRVTRASSQNTALMRFFLMYFVAHDIMSRTASENCLEETVITWPETEDLEEIDMLMGCSRGLMVLINRISALASTRAKVMKSRNLTPTELQQYASASTEIGTALLSLKQNLPMHSAGRQDLDRIAKIKHLAALLYLNERLGPVHQTQDIPTEPSWTPFNSVENYGRGGTGAVWRHKPQERSTRVKKHRAYRPGHGKETPADHHLSTKVESDINHETCLWADGRYKHGLIDSIIRLMSTLPDMATLLWPLFVLGHVGLENEDHRRFVLDRLANLQKTRNLGSVRRATVAVKHAFHTRDLLRPCDRGWGHEKYRYISLA